MSRNKSVSLGSRAHARVLHGKSIQHSGSITMKQPGLGAIAAPPTEPTVEPGLGSVQKAAPAHRGLLEPGNIDLGKRPVVRNPDGSISTVRSMSFGVDGREVLVPTVSDDGRIMSEDEAIQSYYNTGRHLGMFDTPDAATAYAEWLHQQQEQMYMGRQGTK